MEYQFNKGSEWRKWDLHIHTPYSICQNYGGEQQWDKFIDALERLPSDVKVIGINDYYFIDGFEKVMDYKHKGRLANIEKIFPVIEFRVDTFGSGNENKLQKINLHVIFDINDSNYKEEIQLIRREFIEQIHITKLDKHRTKILSIENLTTEGGNDLKQGFSDLIPSTEEVLELLGTSQWKNKVILLLGYKEWSNLDKNNQLKPFKENLYGRVSAFFTSNSQTLSKSQEWLDEYGEKPLLHSEDIHGFDVIDTANKNEDGDYIESQKYQCNTWIKADPTFEGLKQILIEKDRIFIGDEPNLLKRVRENKTKFIRSLTINKKRGVNLDDLWFQDFHIDLNSSLVAIIGNKGGGKSAIADIISLCGNTYQDVNNFSFLTSSKFRKIKPSNLSEKFEAILTWENNSIFNKNLNENPQRNEPELVKYIPQNFLEKLCANVDKDEFEKEIKKIIFAHTPEEERLDKTTLDDLINYKSSLINDEIDKIKIDISNSNKTIIELENKLNTHYKTSIENELTKKKAELEAHNSIKPVSPQIDEKIVVNTEKTTQIEKLREAIKANEDLILNLKTELTILNIKVEELNRAYRGLSDLQSYLESYKDEKKEPYSILLKYEVNSENIFTYKIDLQNLIQIISKTKERIVEISDLLNSEKVESKPNIVAKQKEELELILEELGKPEKEKQKYLSSLKEWEEKQKEITGDKTTSQSLKYFEQELILINDELPLKLQAQKGIRLDLVKQLFSRKSELLAIRKSLFAPITKHIDNYVELRKRYDIKFDATLEFKSFIDNFLSKINQGRTGSFYGKEDGNRMLNNIVDQSNIETKEGFILFTEKIIDSLMFDIRNGKHDPNDINNQLRDGITLLDMYDYIFNFDYLQPTYSLNLGNKKLEELSPGERGALLLVFYLVLDKDDIPLIIDQPEENLDNESVYHILVHFIKTVKNQRQIIIVTHNPNLAVVCDADQIIHMRIDKKNKNSVDYVSGSIENPIIKESIITILEGTLPAFSNRKLKYDIKE